MLTLPNICRLKGIFLISNFLITLFISLFILLFGSTLSFAASATYNATPALNIPDNGCPTYSTITLPVTDNFILSDVNIGININHTYQSDMRIRLTSPQGSTIFLSDGSGTGNNNFDIMFDDAAASSITTLNATHNTSAPYYENLFRPTNALSAFNGQNAQGNWIVGVCDKASADTGSVSRVQLVLTGSDPYPSDAGVAVCRSAANQSFMPIQHQVSWTHNEPIGTLNPTIWSTKVASAQALLPAAGLTYVQAEAFATDYVVKQAATANAQAAWAASDYLTYTFTTSGSVESSDFFDVLSYGLYSIRTFGQRITVLVSESATFATATEILSNHLVSPPTVAGHIQINIPVQKRIYVKPSTTYYVRVLFHNLPDPVAGAHWDDFAIGFANCADYGDLDASYGAARHKMPPNDGLRLGAQAPDAEDGTLPALNASGDDTNGADDEEGITLPTFTQGQASTITATVVGTGGYLQGWMDWNGNGVFDAAEQVATNLQDNGAGDTNPATGIIAFNVNVPANATTTPTYARFRWSSTTGLNSTAAANDGEVEDYTLTITPSSMQSLLGKVWFDTNKDGIQNDGADAYIEGALVELYATATNTIIATTTTNSSGSYQFSNSNGLQPSTNYQLRIRKLDTQVPFSAWSLTTANAGSDDTLDSDADLNANYWLITLTSPTAGNTATGYDFGLITNHTLGCLEVGSSGLSNESISNAHANAYDFLFASKQVTGICMEPSEPSPQFGDTYQTYDTDRLGFTSTQKSKIRRLFSAQLDPDIVFSLARIAPSGGSQVFSQQMLMDHLMTYMSWYYLHYNENMTTITATYINGNSDYTAEQNTVLKALMLLIANRVAGSNGQTQYPEQTIFWLWNMTTTNRQDIIAPALYAQGSSCAVLTDHGDAPATYGDPTHIIMDTLKLGANGPDSESALSTPSNGTGDDANGTDDEDGITLPTFIQGQVATITATVAGAGGYLQGWIDWNGDGDFADSGEQVATNIQDNLVGDSNNTAGTIAFNVTVPTNAVTNPTYARFRWSTTQGLNATAAANDGEVEDYALTIAPSIVLNIKPVVPPSVCTTTSVHQLDAFSVATAIGAGVSGVPSLTYTVPAGSKRMMLAILAVERDHSPFTNRGDNFAASTPAVNTFASVPDLTFGSMVMNKFTYNFEHFGSSNTAANAEISREVYVYTLWDSQIPTGANSFTLPANFNLPLNAGDEATLMVATFGNVQNLEWITGGNDATAPLSLSFAANPAATGEQPMGTSTTDNMLLSWGHLSSSNSINTGAGWTRLAEVILNNGGGTYTTAGGRSNGLYSENDGISLVVQAITGTAVTQTASVSTSSSAFSLGSQVFRLVAGGCDYSDAPASYGAPTHGQTSTRYLGSNYGDADTAPMPSIDALGDDASGLDDEDGMTLPALTQGQAATITATVVGTGGYLQGWMDWNGNGVFDAAEQVVTNLQDNGAGDTNSAVGTIAFTVNVPATAVTTPTYARFRWSSTSGLNSTAAASDGEVEDYAITIATPVIVNCPPEAAGSGSGYASSGTGLYKNNIFWLDWSCGGVTQFNPGTIVNKSWTLANGLQITANLSNITATLAPYNTGDWGGDLLDDLYGGLNPIGLSNKVFGEDPTYDISFSASLNGVSLPTDVVIANAEDTGEMGEPMVVTTDGSPFQPIETTGNAIAQFSNGARTVTTDSPGISSGDTLLLLTENMTKLNVNMSAGGVQALAYGFFVPFDFGDAPSGYPLTDGHYLNPSANSGSQPTNQTQYTSLTMATLTFGEQFYLGSLMTDAENTSQVSMAANGDDNTGTDDEDGITLPTLTRGQTATISATVNGAGGYLQGWMDWNGDGDFADSGEQVATNLQDNGAGDTNSAVGTIDFTVNVPATAVTTPTYARFRWSSTSGLNSTAAASDGEVEDYAMTISPSGPLAPPPNITIGNSRMCGTIGSDKIDGLLSECPNGKVVVGVRHTDRAVGIPNSADGMTVDIDLLCASVNTDGTTVSIVVDGAYTDFPSFDQQGAVTTATCPAGTVAQRMGGWDRITTNGWPWASAIQLGCRPLKVDALGRVQVNTSAPETLVSAGNLESNGTHTLRGLFGGVDAYDVIKGYRAQDGGEGFDGVNISCAPLQNYDYGDAPSALGSPKHLVNVGTLYLGSGIPDAETITLNADVTGGSNGTGDDLNRNDDEDGVMLPVLSQGQSATINATVTGAGGYLQGWIDWNGDGDFADSGEQVATNIQDNLVGDSNNTAGTIAFNVTVPANAVTVPTYARFRWSTTQGLNATAAANDGEVEDYAITIRAAVNTVIATPASYAVCKTTSVEQLDAFQYATATGTGLAGIPSLNYTAPAGANRLMVAVLTLEREHLPAPRGDNFESVPAATFPVVSFGGVAMQRLAHSVHSNGSSSIFGNAELSRSYYFYVLFDLSIPVGSNAVQVSNINTPLSIGDDAILAVATFANVGSVDPVTNLADDSAPFSITMTAAPSMANPADQPPGTTGADNLLMAFGLSTRPENLTIGAGWSKLAEIPVMNNAGTYATSAERSGSVYSESDGHTLLVQAIKGVTTDQTVQVSSAFNDLAMLNSHVFRLRAHACDYGDAPASYGEAYHAQSWSRRLGVQRGDAEATTPLAANALGDDSHHLADEDGVTFANLVAGQVSTISVNVAGSAYLSAWIDWNGNGVFDASETIANDLADNGVGDNDTTVGVITVSVNVPLNAVSTQTYARFRWSINTGVGATGFGSYGEVEDYALTILAANAAPIITSNGGGDTASITLPELTTLVTTVTATDADNDVLTYSINGGADAARFTIDANTGVLSFITAPDFEAPSDADANNSYLVQVAARDGKGGVDTQLITITITNLGEGVSLSVRGLLQGPYDVSTQLMLDQLRLMNLLPTNQPYSRYPSFNYQGNETVSSARLAVTGFSAVVDWVLVELRSATNPSITVARKAALLTREGIVVDAVTNSEQLFIESVIEGSYYVVLRHRNHLAVMTQSPIVLATTTNTLVDFRLSTTPTYGAHAQVINSGNRALMRAGNANVDNSIIANGPNNDATVILMAILMAEGNETLNANYMYRGYLNTDINMDGYTIFAGPNNELNFLIGNIIFHPANSTVSENYVVLGNVP